MPQNLFVCLCLTLITVSYVSAQCQTPWTKRIDIDLEFFLGGITSQQLDIAETQIHGGYRVLIFNRTIYAVPLASEAENSQNHRKHPHEHPHEWLLLFARMMCTYDVPDIEFVLNVHDRKRHPNFGNKVPIFSWGKDIGEDYDILLPYFQLLYYNSSLKHMDQLNIAWEQKIAKAVWRGTTTGGTFTNFNWPKYPRALMVSHCQRHHDFCDAGFVDFPQTDPGVSTAINMTFGKARRMKLDELLRYKYAVVCDGNAAPSSRLALFMQSESLLLKQESPSIEWFYDDLRPYEHYVPLSYLFGDLKNKILWARHNDHKCKQIVQTAKRYAEIHFTEYQISCYIYTLFERYGKLLRFKPVLSERFVPWKLTFPNARAPDVLTLAKNAGVPSCKFYANM